MNQLTLSIVLFLNVHVDVNRSVVLKGVGQR